MTTRLLNITEKYLRNPSAINLTMEQKAKPGKVKILGKDTMDVI